MGDRVKKNVPVEHEFTFYGLPATLVVELETGRGNTIRVPIGDLATFTNGDYYSEIRVPVRGEILRRVMSAVDDSEMCSL